MGCKNKNTYINEVREREKEGREDGRDQRELICLYYLLV